MNTRRYVLIAAGLALLLFLCRPQAPISIGEPARGTPFTWDRAQFWTDLEQRFVRARPQSCTDLQSSITTELGALQALIAQIEPTTSTPRNPLWDEAERQMLSLAPLLAACPRELPRYMSLLQRLRRAVKHQAALWPPDAASTRNRLYRLLYGGRSAVEEIMLQALPDSLPEVTPGFTEPSGAPAVTVHGVAVHSGDILVSRGGAPTSALIARGSDYPGNFSHAALVRVNPQTGQAVVIEALIETGLIISTLDHYLADKKLRIMLLRPRADLPAMRQNPRLAHEAAEFAFKMASQGHIAYDFKMDFQDHAKMFCAEVIYAAYEHVGIRLWTGLSRISAPGTAAWLAAFGVNHFTTLEPSDLEYDTNLTAVAEWRDARTLFKDHVDNAVTDAMLEGANAGEPMEYNRFLLPLVRIVKGYSAVKNLFGATGPVPEGMGAGAALRNRWYSRRHGQLAEGVIAAAEDFKTRLGYVPPYWELVKLAGEAKNRRDF